MIQIPPKKIALVQILFAFLVIIFFIWFGAFYQEKKYHKQGYGETDFAIFYVIGASVTHKLNINTADLYNTKIVRPLVQKIRNHEGGTHFIYPPITALFFAPLTLFPYQTSYHIFLVINCLIIIAAFYLSIALFDKKLYLWRYSLIFLCFTFSASVNNLLSAGQVNGLIWLLIVLCAWLLIKNKSSIFNAASFVMALFFKIIPIILLPYFILKKQWKLLLMIFGVFIFLSLISVIIFSVHLNAQYLNDILFKRVISGDVGSYLSDTSLYGSLYLDAKTSSPMWFGLIKKDFVLYLDIIHKIITVLVFALIIVLFWLDRKNKNQKMLILDISLLILFVLLFSKGSHSSFNLLAMPAILILLSLELIKKNIWLLIIGCMIFIYSQFWNIAPWINDKAFLIFRAQNIGILLLFILIIALKIRYLQTNKRLV